MTEIEIVKKLFKASSTKENITVVYGEGNSCYGVVTFFDGENVSIDGQNIILSSVIDIVEGNKTESKPFFNEPEEKVDISNLKMKKVEVSVILDGQIKDYIGTIFAIKDDKFVLVNDSEKVIINTNDLKSAIEINETSLPDSGTACEPRIIFLLRKENRLLVI